MLGIASAVSAYAIYQLVARPLITASEDVLYGQWSTVAGGLVLNDDGSVAYKPGALPETYGDPPTPVEITIYPKDGKGIAQAAKRSLPERALLGRAQAVLGGAAGAYFDAREPRSGSP